MASAAPSQAATAARWLEVLGLRTEADLLPSDYDPSSLAAVLETAGDATLTEPLLAEWSAPEADWEEALEWMSARFGPRPAGSPPSVLDSPSYALAMELTMVREGPVARALLFELIAAHAAEPYPESTDGLGCAGCRARNGRLGGCGSGWWRWQGATVAVRACGQEETAVGRRSQACWRQAVERSARPSGVRSGAGSPAAGRGRR